MTLLIVEEPAVRLPGVSAYSLLTAIVYNPFSEGGVEREGRSGKDMTRLTDYWSSEEGRVPP